MKKIITLALVLTANFCSTVQPVLVKNVSPFTLVLGAWDNNLIKDRQYLAVSESRYVLQPDETKDIDINDIVKIAVQMKNNTDTIFCIAAAWENTTVRNSKTQCRSFFFQLNTDGFINILKQAEAINSSILINLLNFPDLNIIVLLNETLNTMILSANTSKPTSDKLELDAIQQLLSIPIAQRILWGERKITKNQTEPAPAEHPTPPATDQQNT